MSSLSLERLRGLNGAVGAELTIHPVLEARGDKFLLRVRAVNVNGSNSRWQMSGMEPTALAHDLGASVILRLRPEAEFRDLFDRFSPDPVVNRPYANGIDQLRTDGVEDAKPYFL